MQGGEGQGPAGGNPQPGWGEPSGAGAGPGAPPGGFGPGGAPPGPAPDAAQRLLAPAILLMVVAGLDILYDLYQIISTAVGAGPDMDELQRSFGPDASQWMQMGQGVAIVWNVFSLVVSGFLIFAGLQMKNLQRHTVCMVAAIVALIPCITSPCCVLGIPVGIWALVLLLKPEIKAAFTS